MEYGLRWEIGTRWKVEYGLRCGIGTRGKVEYGFKGKRDKMEGELWV